MLIYKLVVLYIKYIYIYQVERRGVAKAPLRLGN